MSLLAERLDKHSEPYVEGRCQLWLGAKSAGYGVLKFEGRMLRAHRAAWISEHGPIPAGANVLHSCDEPTCRNINHLFLGTHAINMADKIAKGRGNNGHTITMSNRDHSEKQFNVRLTDEERAILDLERERLGLRHTGDVIRLWIGAVRERRKAIEAETVGNVTKRDRASQREMAEA